MALANFLSEAGKVGGLYKKVLYATCSTLLGNLAQPKPTVGHALLRFGGNFSFVIKFFMKEINVMASLI